MDLFCTKNRTKSKELFPSTLSLSSQTDLTKLPQKEQIEKLHVIYDEQEEFLSDIKDDLKRNYVASAECKHVEMCINDVEVYVYHNVVTCIVTDILNVLGYCPKREES